MNSPTNRATVHAQEILMAVPSRLTDDIYELHQTVWSTVKASQQLDRKPLILYRRDGGMITVRISDAPMNRARPVKAEFADGQSLEVDVNLALWRSPAAQTTSAQMRAKEMLQQHGLQVHRLTAEPSLAHGYKSRLDAQICLPVARVWGQATVIDHRLVAKAWAEGIGRGRRFGYGMMATRPSSH